MTFSIITVNYNNLEGLKRTFKSIDSQTFTDREWIIIDGGSTDGSEDFIKQHNSKLSFWCSEQDRGIYNAMNKGIDHATGEYLIFMNSGDAFYDTEVLEKVSLIKNKSDIISGIVYWQENGKQIRWYHKNILIQLYEDTLNHQGSFIRRTLFERTRYDETLKIVSDWKFFLESIIIYGASFEYTDLAIARQEGGGISIDKKYSDLNEIERQKVLNDFFSPLMLNEISRLKAYENCGAAIRAKELYEKGPLTKFLIRSVAKLLSIIFIHN